MPGKRSMTYAYLRSLVVLATAPVVVLGYLWITDQHHRFEKQSRSWRVAYIENQQQALHRRVADIVGSLDFERRMLDRRQRESLEQAVDNGMAQLDSLVRFSADRNAAGAQAAREQMLRRARELLAPIRFGSGRDHYVLFRDDAVALLLPEYADWQGRDVSTLRDVNGVLFAAQLMQQARDNGSAALEAWFPQTDGHRGAWLTTQYVRYYAPLGVFVGAVAYADDMTAALQREELARLATIAGKEDMVLRVVDNNNVVLLDTLRPDLQGRPVPADEDANAVAVQQLQQAITQPDGGFAQVLRATRAHADSQRTMLMYLRHYPGWHWNISAGFFLDPLETAIAQQRKLLLSDIDRRVLEGVLILGLLVILAVVIAGQLAQRTRHALHNFTRFFGDASRNASSIDVKQLPYSEFEQLAREANAMVEQRSQIEHALRMSEQRFETALAASSSHLWDFDLREKSIAVGGSLFKQLGYSPEARRLDVDEWWEWIHPDDLPEMLRRSDSAEGFTREFRIRSHAGNYCWFVARGGDVEFDANGKPLRALGILTDISANKLMEQELIAARIAAEDASHAKSQFLSSISHELRTPLNGVLGYAQILLRDASASPEQRHNLRAIESCGQHLLTLIDDVLDLAKIESGKIEIHETACDLYDLLESVSNIVRERVEAKGLKYVLEIDKHVPGVVRIDEVKLRQILVNLLANAVKFTECGGVTLSVALRDEATLLFQVQDTGVGIPADRLRAIFEPFRQLETSMAGTGLGLPISQRLCEAMGGNLSVKSVVGTGSSFSFYLPLRRADAVPTARPLRQDYQVIDTGGRRVEVMVVDDNSINRQVLAGMLRASGIEVREAENGQDALDKLRQNPVPLVLMDVRMPVMDGFAATAAIKSDPLLSDIVVIAVSASAFPDVIERMRAHGCTDFVGKPVRVAELLNKVSTYLNLPLQTHLIQEDDRVAPATQMPMPVRLELASAIALGDLERMRTALQPLHKSSPHLIALAKHIEHLLNDFDIDAVCKLIADNSQQEDNY